MHVCLHASVHVCVCVCIMQEMAGVYSDNAT